MYDNIKSKIVKAMDDIEKSDSMTCRDLEILDKLTHTWKSLLTIEAMTESEAEELL